MKEYVRSTKLTPVESIVYFSLRAREVIFYILKGSTKRLSTACEVPLFGSFACRTAVQPYCAIKEIQIGCVNISEVKKSGHSSRTTSGAFYYCTLVNSYLYCYNSDRDRRLLEMAIRVDKVSLLNDKCNCDSSTKLFFAFFFAEKTSNNVEKKLVNHLRQLSAYLL